MPLAFIASNWRWVLPLVILAGLGLALFIQGERLSSAQKDRDTYRRDAGQWKANATEATATANANAAALEQYKADLDHANQVADVARAKSETLSRNLNDLKKEIHNASTDQDGPVAVILRVTLDRLRRITAASDAGDAGQDRAAAGAGRVTVVHVGP